MFSRSESTEFDTWRLFVREYSSRNRSADSSLGRYRIEFRPRFITWLGGRREPFEEFGDFDVAVDDRGIVLTYLDPKPELQGTVANIPLSAFLQAKRDGDSTILILARPGGQDRVLEIRVGTQFLDMLSRYIEF